MILTVVTKSTTIENEHELIAAMFRRGLKYLHVRKPNYSRESMIDYIEKFPKEYHNKIILHSHHSLALSLHLKGIHLTEKLRKNEFGVWKKFNLYRIIRPKMHISASFHKIKDLKDNSQRFDYVFFSSVFESITKENHKASYSLRTIFNVLNNDDEIKAIALGGVDDEKISICYETKFSGIALSGYLWELKNPVENFEKAKIICDQYKNKL